MRAFGVFGPHLGASANHVSKAGLCIDGMYVRPKIVRISAPAPDLTRQQSSGSVLVKVSAFSCNFRDKGAFRGLQTASQRQFRVIGSEFAGHVVATGNAVGAVRVGDRVIGQNAYAGCSVRGAPASAIAIGLPTDRASCEFLVLREDQVAVIPPAMSLETAAGFGIAAQTAFSMVRRSGIQGGQRALVTSAGSNTSIALISALVSRGVWVVAATSSPLIGPQLLALGVKRVLSTDALTGVRDQRRAFAQRDAVPAVDAVFDPFCDLHLDCGVYALAPGGVYVTCGLAAQNPVLERQAAGTMLSTEQIMRCVMLNNLMVIGNCLGTAGDLRDALHAYCSGALQTVTDRVYTDADCGAFLHRTFVDRARFGKVVLVYADT
jgi:NADPH:quinone reductase-like Zn-dependent oxidoreductase